MPDTFSNFGSKAQNTTVCAPCRGLFINGHINGFKIIVENQLLKKLMCLIISVSTRPGCNAFTITPVSKIKIIFPIIQGVCNKIPFSFLANSLVNKIFANLLCA